MSFSHLTPAELHLAPDGRLAFRGCLASWRLELLLPDGRTESLAATEMAAFSSRINGADMGCEWRGSRFGAAATVTVRWHLTEDGLLLGHLAYEGVTTARVAKIHFPIVAFPEEEECALLTPNGGGRLIRDARRNVFDNQDLGDGFQWKYNQIQAAAFLAGARSLYFDTRDTAGYLHEYRFGRSRATASFVYEAILPVPQDDASPAAYALPYEAGIKPFAGGWFEAAEIYRSWALKQTWATRKRRSGTVDALGAWVWNRGASEEIIPPVERLRQDLGLPVALDWYWWHRHPYDTAYPCYFPPREGVENFSAALRRLKQNGILSQVYVNGMLWDMDDASWAEGGDDAVIINRDGTPKAEVFNAFLKHRLAFICGESAAFQQRIHETVRKLHDCGLNGVYLDVIGNAWSLPCHNPVHRHAPGGGNYQVQGYRRMLEKLRAVFPDMLFSSESCAEAFMDLLDTGILLDASAERFPWTMPGSEPVPLFQAVYHAVFPLFGNYSCIDGIPPFDPLWPQDGRWKTEQNWHRLFPDQFQFEIARCIVWGLQPTIVNLRQEHVCSDEYRQEYDFFLNAAKFHHAHREHLLLGTMLPPGELETPAVDVSFLQRFVFTRENEHRSVTRTFPAILHSLWEDSRGRRKLVLANYSRTAAPFAWRGRDGSTLTGDLPPHAFQAADV